MDSVDCDSTLFEAKDLRLKICAIVHFSVVLILNF